MTWKPYSTRQPTLDESFARRDWSSPTSPVRRHVARKTVSVAPVRSSLPASDWERMWELKRRVAARVQAGEVYEAALEAVKRELWPDQYQNRALTSEK